VSAATLLMLNLIRQKYNLACQWKWSHEKYVNEKKKNAEGTEETIDIIAFFFKPSQN
jgi:hypothetical protein